MHIADVTVTGRIGAEPLSEALLEICVVEITNWRFDEVAAAHHTIAINRNDALSSTASVSQAGIVACIQRKERIDRAKLAHLVCCVGMALVGVDPEVDLFRQFLTQRLDLFHMFWQPNDANAKPHLALEQLPTLRQEALARGLTRMIGGPERD